MLQFFLTFFLQFKSRNQIYKKRILHAKPINEKCGTQLVNTEKKEKSNFFSPFPCMSVCVFMIFLFISSTLINVFFKVLLAIGNY